jgi:hypothetical protein
MACRKLYVIAAALLVLPACRAGTFTVEWTVQGVDTYRSALVSRASPWRGEWNPS